MSEKKKKLIKMNQASLKINRISLLNQSGFNFSLKKVIIPKSKLDFFKEISLKNKGKEKPFDIYFNPMQNMILNSKINDNHYKWTPLLEKNKIIRKHNILQKIDFNPNIVKNSPNLKLELNINNNNNSNNNKNNKHNNNNNNHLRVLNKNKSNIKPYLPLLTNNSTDTIKNQICNKFLNKIYLIKKKKVPH